ncbi:MAG: AAA family ATPase [Candidatus Omnitrophica bacterium]|nr:AAA family ATPase [Candidatus Omnitrophota bacterium]
MYFKKLEIFGFKSFADKTVLKFDAGISAIVGPNGCGKSNVFDSIRWVLGEQKVKELRGTSMEDVIFNGTQFKQFLGFAEVSVTFENLKRQLAFEADEVTVTRRLFRSGESEYLLNRTVCRLKDIQELMMGTGIGAESYSLVQQGRVDSVVSARPEERRAILDEAAGITKYKLKKKEALNKLTAADNNLLRVNDIVIEVKRQIGSIERQANRARKYKEQMDRLTSLELKMAKYDIKAFTEQRAASRQILEDLKDKDKNLTAELEKISEFLNHLINNCDDVEQEINVLKSDEIRISGQIELNQNQIDFNEERLSNIDQNDQRLIEQKEKLIERCKIQQQKIEELKAALVSTQAIIDNGESTLITRKDELTRLEHDIRAGKQKISGDEEKIMQLTSQQIQARNCLNEIMKETQGALARKKRLDLEQEKVSSEKALIENKFAQVNIQVQDMRATIEDLVRERDQKEEFLNTLESRFKEMESLVNDLERKKLFLISQKEFTEKLHTQYQESPDPIIEGSFMTAAMPEGHHTGIIGKVKNVRAIDADGLQKWQSLNGAAEPAAFMHQIVCEMKFIELDPQQISAKIEEISRSIDEQVLIKQEVELQIQAERAAFKSLFGMVHNKEKMLSILETQRQDVVNEQVKLTSELDLLSSELDEVNGALTEVKAREERGEFDLESLTKEIEWCKNDIKDQQDWIVERARQKEEMAVAVAQLEAEIHSEHEKMISQKSNESLFVQTLDASLDEIKKIENDMNGQTDKRSVYEDEMRAFGFKIDELKQEQESTTESLSEFEAKRLDMGSQINSVREQMKSVEEELDSVKQNTHNQQMALQEIGFSEKSLKDMLLQIYKIDFDRLMETVLQSSALQFTGVNPYQGLTYHDAQDCLMLSYTGPDLKLLTPEDDDMGDVSAMREEIAKLRKYCDSFGAVNLVAIDEYEELKERFQFLTKQQCDLLEAKSQLMETIKKINRSTRQMFMETFEKVNEQFKIYFKMLFGGGEAELILLDPENVLESGIDIVARPPGKKPQSISLLSGGERTMAAIALIFGVFKVHPSPFCVLDEIDAALDEANVDRFCLLLKEFAKVAQFIVITHNKKTIAVADILYGVTMPETGVSRIVSVKLSESEKHQTAPQTEPVASEAESVVNEQPAASENLVISNEQPANEEEMAAV